MEKEIKQKEAEGKGMFFIEGEDGIVAELTYTKEDNGIMVLNHTETDPEMTGKGLASKLIAYIVDYARENGLKIDPICEYAAKQFERHKEYQDVQANQT